MTQERTIVIRDTTKGGFLNWELAWASLGEREYTADDGKTQRGQIGSVWVADTQKPNQPAQRFTVYVGKKIVVADIELTITAIKESTAQSTAPGSGNGEVTLVARQVRQ